jgi:circadian clock protein KaiC
MTTSPTAHAAVVPTGVAGLDDLLGGGLVAGFEYVVQGAPGVGKTTLGLEFLREGVRRGERVLYLTLSHSRRDLDAIARSHGWTLDQIPLFEFSAVAVSDRMAREQTVFPPDEVDAGELADPLLEAIAEARPQRVVFDALEQLRLLSERPQRYRRQLLLIRRALERAVETTSLYLTDLPPQGSDLELEAMAHGVLRLERSIGRHGGVVRRLEVAKGRGMLFRSGLHSFRIRTGGLEVYPARGLAAEVQHDERRTLSTGLPELDALLGGGLESGTSCLLHGPVGTGKSAVATHAAVAAAERGERVAVFLTEEREATFVGRAAALGMDARLQVEEGRLVLVRLEGEALTHDEVAHALRGAVRAGAGVVLLDSLNGYADAVEERDLARPLAELLRELGDRGVVTLLVASEGSDRECTTLDARYLADTVVAFERRGGGGSFRRSVSVVKKRLGVHAAGVRELLVGPGGLSLADAPPADTVSGGAPQGHGG